MPTDFSTHSLQDLLGRRTELCRPFYEKPEEADFAALAEVCVEVKKRSAKHKSLWVYLQPDWPLGQRLMPLYAEARKRHPDLPPITWTGDPQQQSKYNPTYVPTAERRFGRRR